MQHVDESAAAVDVRLDVWLDVSCLFKTRSEAQKAIRGGKVSANGQSAKPNRRLRVGDEIEISRPLGRKQRVRVVKLAEQHVAGGIASGATIAFGAGQIVGDNGSAVAGTVLNGGFQGLSGGGIDSGSLIETGGEQSHVREKEVGQHSQTAKRHEKPS